MFSGVNNPAYGKVYRSKAMNPEWVEKIREGTKGVNVGEKNGMKNPEVARRMSATRRERVTSDPEYRSALSAKMKQAWVDGRYDGVRVGRCKWYVFQKSTGELCNLQGTWELAYAQYLDKNGIKFDAHKGRLEYIDDTGAKRSYYPDFLLTETQEYIDVKSDYWLALQKRKFELLREQHKDLSLRIVTKAELQELNILP